MLAKQLSSMEPPLLKSSGILAYSITNGQHRLVLNIDNEIARYYRRLIPRWVDHQPPMYPAHITVVRPYREVVPDTTRWGERDGEVVPFEYGNVILFDGLYFWLNCHGKELEQLRLALGMSPTRDNRGCFHCTIANAKSSQSLF